MHREVSRELALASAAQLPGPLEKHHGAVKRGGRGTKLMGQHGHGLTGMHADDGVQAVSEPCHLALAAARSAASPRRTDRRLRHRTKGPLQRGSHLVLLGRQVLENQPFNRFGKSALHPQLAGTSDRKRKTHPLNGYVPDDYRGGRLLLFIYDAGTRTFTPAFETTLPPEAKSPSVQLRSKKNDVIKTVMLVYQQDGSQQSIPLVWQGRDVLARAP